ncbi:cupin domain-containing protein [Billgrantia diversa]|uniref:dimethylsulfonioproprionate lyase family protein n=1 Tax=Halomonas sp. MCCC 1A13316 TaxID=2733487 RepID=UPI0018A692A1|nr:cupin domain-containing protein [Halomonas sp. MCCC 1A13316]QOR38093.1 cupin domain-containing protein [Halomonas sp. MCCC 1A13316]
MQPSSVDTDDLPWETWDDPEFAARTRVRWKLIFTAEQTPTGVMSMGLAEIAPQGALPLHQHDPAETYHVLSGEGSIEVEGVSHRLHAGQSVFIPPLAWHETINTGPTPLRFLFTFPTDTFSEVAYRFAEH